MDRTTDRSLGATAIRPVTSSHARHPTHRPGRERGALCFKRSRASRNGTPDFCRAFLDHV